MDRSLLRRGLRAVAALGVIGGSLFAGAPLAQAEIPPPGVNRIAAAGSDTTEAFMQSYLSGRTTSTEGATTYNVATYNIPALFNPTGPTITVPGDADCPNGQIVYGPGSNNLTGANTQYTSTSATTFPTPNGSTAGRRFLFDQRIANPDAACVDIARSSSSPGVVGETNTAQYYGFALDTMAWATQSFHAPSTLTGAQIDGIYSCQFNNWDQVGGSTMPIQRILPNPGSGTRAFFQSAFGISDAELLQNSGPNGTCPPLVDSLPDGPDPGTTPDPLQENDGTLIPRQFRESGIIGYSVGRWAYQANNKGNPTIDIRNDVRIGGYTTGLGQKGLAVEFLSSDNAFQLDTISNPGRPATVTELNVAITNPAFNAANDFRGVRMLFNVIDLNSPSYLPARGLVGFNNVAGGNMSPLCDPDDPSGESLADFGFARLNTSNPVGSNAAGSTCRRFLGTG